VTVDSEHVRRSADILLSESRELREQSKKLLRSLRELADAAPASMRHGNVDRSWRHSRLGRPIHSRR
jgi:hypothetical protein